MYKELLSMNLVGVYVRLRRITRGDACCWRNLFVKHPPWSPSFSSSAPPPAHQPSVSLPTRTNVMEPGSDELLARAAERANIAHTIFMLIDSDADGIVAVEHLGSMLTSMLLSQEVKYNGDVETFVQNMTRHRSPPERLVQITFNDFVDLYNSLIDRAKLQQYATTSYPQGSAVSAAVALSRGSSSFGAGTSSQPESPAPPPVPAPQVRRHGAGAAYLVSGAALKVVNGVYSQSGESDGVPKYAYARYSLLRRTLDGGSRCWYLTDHSSATAMCYYCCRSSAGTPPLEVHSELILTLIPQT